MSTNEYTAKHASRRGNAILIVLILYIKTHVYCRCQSKRADIFLQNSDLFTAKLRMYETKKNAGHLHNY